MAKDKYVISSCYSEYETAKDILLFKKERITTFKRHILNETIQYYYILMVKYLLSLNSYSFDFIKIIIRRHVAIAAYMYCRDKLDKGYFISSFDDIINKDISLDNLKKTLTYKKASTLCNPFWELYEGKNYDDIKESIANISGEKEETYALLSTVFDYFYYGCKFADLKYYNRSDLLVVYGMHNFKFNNFSFGVSDEDFITYWITTQKFKEKDIKERVLGHIINIIMTNNNLGLTNEMNLKPKYYYEMMFNEARKDPFKNRYSFFEADFKNRIATINIDAIKKSFKFKYNDKDYIFTVKGIIEC